LLEVPEEAITDLMEPETGWGTVEVEWEEETTIMALLSAVPS